MLAMCTACAFDRAFATTPDGTTMKSGRRKGDRVTEDQFSGPTMFWEWEREMGNAPAIAIVIVCLVQRCCVDMWEGGSGREGEGKGGKVTDELVGEKK